MVLSRSRRHFEELRDRKLASFTLQKTSCADIREIEDLTPLYLLTSISGVKVVKHCAMLYGGAGTETCNKQETLHR